MRIENTPLENIIGDIFNGGSNPVHSVWGCLIITPNGNIEPIKMISLDIERNYLENFSDLINLEFIIGSGAYIHDILSYKDELIVEITRTPLNEDTGIDASQNSFTRRFRGILKNESNSNLEEGMGSDSKKDIKDISDITTVKMQLLNLALEEIRLYETGGIFRNELSGNVLKYMLSKICRGLKLSKEDSIDGVDVVEYDNQTPNVNTVIPHGTKIEDLATFLQDECGGIYSSGIGSYLQDNLWYIWPEYNYKRYDKELKNLTIINVPSNRYSGVERTYAVKDFGLTILSTGDAKHIDSSHYDQLNNGNAIRFVSGKRIMAGFGITKDNKFTITRSKNVSEFAGVDRPNYNVVLTSPRRITDNVFAEASSIAKRNGSFISLVWENSQPELIYPGMPSKLLYLNNGDVMELEGIVVKSHHYIHDSTVGPIVGRHTTNSGITMFIENYASKIA